MSDSPKALDYASKTIELAPELSDSQRRRGLRALGLAVAAVGFAMAVQGGLNFNFLVEEFGISGFEMGLIEAVRETCGIVAFAFLAILAGLAEPLIGMAMLLVLAGGLGSYAFVPTYFWVVLMSVVWSQGLHVWMPLPNLMAMSLAEPGRTGHRLGQVGSAGAAGLAGGLAVALLLSLLKVPMRPMYILAAAAAAVGAVACLGIPRDIKTPGPRLVLRSRYSLFYLLSFLEGWRKQIFICFAGFLLVKNYGTPRSTMLMLMGLVQIIGWLTAPRVGRLIDRIGERRVLVFYYSCLTAFFLCYAAIPNRWALYALFVIDNAFFVFALALTTYVNRIAPRTEHTATLSMGVAMNHVASVGMPLVGGILWAQLGYQWPFLLGALAAAASIVASLLVPKHLPVAETAILAESATPAAETGEQLTEQLLR